MDQEENKIPDTLLKLIEGCSTYLKVSINFWIVLAVFSILIILPTEAGETKVAIPFNLGTVDKISFFPFANLFISLLLISFGATFCQATRTKMLIQKIVDKRTKEQPYFDDIHIQDLIDSIVYPSLNRVAPLAQILQGRYQFFPDAEETPRWRKRISFVYYLLLKFIAILALYLLPAYALIRSFFEGLLFKSNPHAWNIPAFVFWVLNIIAIIILVQLFIIDLFYIKRVIKRVLK